ncbi:hypothetical protein MRX96_058677 [Rhipicephalus microplus]
MKNKRRKHDNLIERLSARGTQQAEEEKPAAKCSNVSSSAVMAGEEEIGQAFATVINNNTKVPSRKGAKSGAASQSAATKSKKAKPASFKDEQFYIPHFASDFHSEKGLELEKTFEQQASQAVLDLTGDDDKYLRKQKSALKWDRKRKRFVRDDSDPKKKKIRTESGAWIPASYKSDVYKQWRKKAQMDARDEGGDDDDEGEAGSGLGKQKVSACDRLGKRHSGPARQKGPKKHFRRELKTKEEILKTRKRKARINYHVKKKHMERAAKKRRT